MEARWWKNIFYMDTASSVLGGRHIIYLIEKFIVKNLRARLENIKVQNAISEVNKPKFEKPPLYIGWILQTLTEFWDNKKARKVQSNFKTMLRLVIFYIHFYWLWKFFFFCFVRKLISSKIVESQKCEEQIMIENQEESPLTPLLKDPCSPKEGQNF